MRFNGWLWAMAAMILLTFSGGAMADTTITLTSTADWDAGVKAPTADENLGIESSTDNLGIATGVFELGSLKGDSFGSASVDANTAKWNIFSTGVCQTNTQSIAGGVLNEDLECLTGGTAGVYGAATITGDWDMSIKLDKTVDTGTTNQWFFATFSVANSFCAGVLEDGILYAIVDANLGAYTCINSVFAQVGTNTAVPSDPVWLRITRATNTFTWFHSTDGVAYTQDEQTTTASIPNPLIPYVALFADSLAEPTGADWDDYRVNSGTVGSGGFRTAGQWTSDSQTDTDPDEITNITVTYLGASAANYITSMTLLDGAGATLFFDGTDVTSGITKSYTVPNVLPGANWKVRLNMTGDGTGTPTITSIVITALTPAAPPSGCFGESAFGIVLFSIFGVIAGVAIFAGVFIAAQKDGSDLDAMEMGILIVGIVVLLAIVGVMLGVFNTGATIGC